MRRACFDWDDRPLIFDAAAQAHRRWICRCGCGKGRPRRAVVRTRADRMDRRHCTGGGKRAAGWALAAYGKPLPGRARDTGLPPGARGAARPVYVPAPREGPAGAPPVHARLADGQETGGGGKRPRDRCTLPPRLAPSASSAPAELARGQCARARVCCGAAGGSGACDTGGVPDHRLITARSRGTPAPWRGRGGLLHSTPIGRWGLG